MRFVYQCMAVAAAIIATIYFIVYHGMLKPRCHAQSVQNSQRSHPTVVQGKYFYLCYIIMNIHCKKIFGLILFLQSIRKKKLTAANRIPVAITGFFQFSEFLSMLYGHF